MRITHLYHSGFLVELKNQTLLFDWYPMSQEKLMADYQLIRRDKKLYVFVSHTHSDHYLPSVWNLAKSLPGTDPTFIVDEEVAATAPKDDSLDIVSCGPEEIVDIDDDMTVTTLDSTDEGIAFCVEVAGRTIYHAGDLSVWWWPERSDLLNEASERTCSHYLEVIEGKRIDVAFLPITPRAGSEGDRGIELFMRQIGADVVVPMHYRDDLAGARALADSARLAPWRDRMRFDDRFEL